MYAAVFLALAASAWLVLRRSPLHALLAVWLPLLLLVPESFRATFQGIPKMNFNQAAMVPIALAAFWRYGRDWRPTVTDGAVIGLAAIIAVSEFLAAGYKEAQNLMFATLASMAGPYLAARLLLRGREQDVAVARRLVILVFAAVLVGFYELRFGVNPFLRYLGALFPGQGEGWVTTFRHGLARVAGPYSHAILAGLMAVIAYRMQRWLQWGSHWEPRFGWLPGLPWSKASVITATLAFGTVVAVARGPILGALLGAALIAVVSSPRRRVLLPAAAVALTVLVAVGYVALLSYLDVQPGVTMSLSQETALYRKVMVERYFDIALEHALLGWGRNTWPKLMGLSSIDNYFLLLALMHGVVAMALFAFVFAWQGARLLRRGLAEPPGSNSLALTFAGILLAVFVTLGTVYLGEQVMPTLFFLLGWSEALLLRSRAAAAPPVTAAPAAAPRAAPQVGRLRIIR